MYLGFDLQQAEDTLKRDLQAFETELRKSIKVKLNDDRIGELVAFAYNFEVGGFNKFTALKIINLNDVEGVGKAILVWNKDNFKGVKVELKNLPIGE